MENTLNTMLSSLKQTYKNIDIRAVLAKSKADGSWYCIFLKARLTNQDIHTIKQIQKKQQACSSNEEYLKIVLDCKKIDEIDFFINDIQGSKVNLSGILSRPIGYSHEAIRDNEIHTDSGFTTDDDRSGYEHKMVYIGMNDNLITTIHSLGINEDEMGVTLQEIRYCLDVPSISSSVNIVLLFPIYCKRIPLLTEEKGKYLAKFQIHKALVSLFKAKVRLYHGGEIGTIPKDIQPLDLIGNVQDADEMVTARLPMISQIEDNDYVEIDIYHRSIPALLITEKLWGREVISEDKLSREQKSNEVFIVHGHDSASKYQLASSKRSFI